jgi:hypothetical protein
MEDVKKTLNSAIEESKNQLECLEKGNYIHLDN